ncbi:MAG: outer membrane beta-barrel protein [Gemmatimonadota bacterium]
MHKTLFLAAAALVPAIASAQSAKGFQLGAALNGSSIKSEETIDESRESGGGLSLLLGYGFNSRFSVFLEGSGAVLDVEGSDWTLGHGDLGIRYHFSGSGRKFVPFIDGAFTTILGRSDDAELENGSNAEVELTGTGFSVGAGFDYFFSPRTAFVLGLRYTDGELDEVKVGNVTVDGFDFDVTTTRLNLGLRWFFGAR